MKIFSKQYILYIFLALILNSCRKKEVINIITPPIPVHPQDSSKIDKFFETNMVASQFFTINASTDQVLVGKQGTIISINKGAFKNQAGVPVDGGMISIELKEIYTKGDMISSGIFPVAYSRPLVSGGEFYFLAKQNGADLIIKDTGLIYFKLPYNVTDTNTMSVFNSLSTILQSKTDTLDWGTGVRAVRTIDSAGIKQYFFTIDRMYWINCDYFMNSAIPKTTVYADIADTVFNYTNTMVFFALKNMRTASYLSQYPNKDFRVYNIPIGIDVTFIAIAERNGQYYMGYADSTIVSGHRQPMSLNKCTLADIKSKLATL
jgi:hypothetical protein